MKWKTVLKLSDAVILLILVAVIVQFTMENTPQKETKTKENDVILVLAPYEIRSHQKILDEIAEEYSGLPDNKRVIFEYEKEENYKKEICLRMDRGENADLIICQNQMMPALTKMGVFENISELITAECKNRICYQALWDSAKSNGNYYGIPFSCDPYFLFYNKTVLEKEELELPDTWEELEQLSGEMKQYGTYGFGFPGKRADERSLFFSHILYSTGGSIRNMDKTAGITSFEMIHTLANEKYSSLDTINWSKKDLAEVFLDGEVEMIADSLSALSLMLSEPQKFQIGLTYLPEGVKNSHILLGENIGVSKGAKKEALDFLEYLYSPEVMERITDAMNTLPILYDMEYKPKQIGPDAGAEIADVFREEGYCIEAYDAWFEISAAISESVLNVFTENADTAEQTAIQVHNNVKNAIIKK